MSTKQPKWKYIGNFGDRNFLDYGGALLYEDTTGVYPAELEVIQEPEEGGKEVYRVYRFPLDRLKTVEVENTLYLVPFNYVPSWPHAAPAYDEWFSKDLSGIASTIGMDPDELRADFCSEDIRRRALAYIAVGDYHGYENLDSYPLELTAKEARKRYRKELKAA